MNIFAKGLLAFARTIAHKIGITLPSDLAIVQVEEIVPKGTRIHATVIAPTRFSGVRPVVVITPGAWCDPSVRFVDGKGTIQLWHDHPSPMIIRAITSVPLKHGA